MNIPSLPAGILLPVFLLAAGTAIGCIATTTNPHDQVLSELHAMNGTAVELDKRIVALNNRVKQISEQIDAGHSAKFDKP